MGAMLTEQRGRLARRSGLRGTRGIPDGEQYDCQQTGRSPVPGIRPVPMALDSQPGNVPGHVASRHTISPYLDLDRTTELQG